MAIKIVDAQGHDLGEAVEGRLMISGASVATGYLNSVDSEHFYEGGWFDTGDLGFLVDGEVYLELEGSTPITMAKTVGFGVVEFASEFQRLKPDVVVIIGDRYEALSAAIAAAYMNICIAHIQGGEVSGSIDESARHAITKFAHFHFPSTVRSAEYVVRMGERPDTILGVGCPGSDIARQLDRTLKPEVVNSKGAGSVIDVNKPFLLVLFHPTTTEFGGERVQMEALLESIAEIQVQTLLLWPNIDAGSDHVSKVIRSFREQRKPNWLRTLINLTPENYLQVLAKAACAIGNSSSFVRDAGYLGTPVVLVGRRQEGRETDSHVTHVAPQKIDIERAISDLNEVLASNELGLERAFDCEAELTQRGGDAGAVRG